MIVILSLFHINPAVFCTYADELPRISRMMKRSAASPAATWVSPTREEELSSGHKGSLGAKRATQLLERPPPSGRPPCARPV
jgi:hypothetical protein